MQSVSQKMTSEARFLFLSHFWPSGITFLGSWENWLEPKPNCSNRIQLSSSCPNPWYTLYVIFFSSFHEWLWMYGEHFTSRCMKNHLGGGPNRPNTPAWQKKTYQVYFYWVCVPWLMCLLNWLMITFARKGKLSVLFEPNWIARFSLGNGVS